MAEKIKAGGVTNTEVIRETDGTIHIVEQQDLEPILKHAKAMQDLNKSTNELGYYYDCEIPMVFANKWMLEEGIDVFNPEHAHLVDKKINEPEFRKHFGCTAKMTQGIVFK